MTEPDVERASELCRKRKELHKRACAILMAKKIAVCNPNDSAASRGFPDLFHIVHLTPEQRDLLKREVAAQIATIDQELRALGVEPDELVDPAPEPDSPGVVLPRGVQANPRPPLPTE